MLPTLSLVWVSTMGQSVYAGSETTPPPQPTDQASGQYLLELEVREPHLQHKASVQISRLRGRRPGKDGGRLAGSGSVCSGLRSERSMCSADLR